MAAMSMNHEGCPLMVLRIRRDDEVKAPLDITVWIITYVRMGIGKSYFLQVSLRFR